MKDTVVAMHSLNRIAMSIAVVALAVSCGGSENNTPICVPACEGWQKCVGTTCTLDSSSQWDLIAVNGTVSTYDRSGAAWDVPGGMPDPKVCVTYNGIRYCSLSAPDTFSPYWNTKMLSRAGAGTLESGIESRSSTSMKTSHPTMWSARARSRSRKRCSTPARRL